ncbi:YheC/YheD family protein [Bacillus sp. PS06]|uniref:YheC/YheD family endospore coat-associated protein n=1 Tax=Bacillus sp. PS06 TaxID=2764176 RepID=UPI00177C9FF3|nr:YheC/YheD family protein [Bacillus sp. PS06]MBD8067741.1 YheC/YheD family protein [Bacillus sp. PS06]
MIPLYYDPNHQTWIHQQSNQHLTWGKNKQVISYSGGNVKTMLPFLVSFSPNGQLSPIIGILAGESKKNSSFIGNQQTFIRLQKELAKRGCISIVFTPSSLKNEEMNGFYYSTTLKKWVRIKSPLPNIVYNRIPYRRMEQEKPFTLLLTKLKQLNIPYFNASFFSKYEVYQSLRQHPILTSHLPDTTLYSTTNLISMLNQHQSLYLKLDKGYKGKGLYRITKHAKHYSIHSVKNIEQCNSLVELTTYIDSIVGLEPFLLQEAIQTDTIDSRRYDIRVLAHQDLDNQFILSGIGIRMAGQQNVTTHVPNGGSVLNYSMIEHQINEDLLALLINSIGQQLTEDFQQFIGEFSVDIGKTTKDEYYIFEVNSKPMVFDEPNIKSAGLTNLSDLLIAQANKFYH